MMDKAEVYALASRRNLDELMQKAEDLRDIGHGANISYSRKVFIPLTQLCRDVCHYCTFAKSPQKITQAYLSPDQVLAIAKAGERAGCHEALFTLGDKPEMRYEVARDELKKRGHETTLSYLREMCELVLENTTLLPHINPGVMTADDIAMLRKVSISQGIMLENVSHRLSERGGVHFGSPDKNPKVRLETIRQAGFHKVPFTTGILIGIGETRFERIDSLFALRELHVEYGHIQEIIIQNFRAKPLTKMASAIEPDFEDLLWTVAIARIIFGPEMNIQAPPNLSPESYPLLIKAGLSDWGGISPVTKDFVNPEAPWPQIENLRLRTESMGKVLVERLASYPNYCKKATYWHDSKLSSRILSLVDSDGYARVDEWTAGKTDPLPKFTYSSATSAPISIMRILDKVQRAPLNEEEIITLFQARGVGFTEVCKAANKLRLEEVGNNVSYVVNRNINYTNLCYLKCQFCAFSKGKLSENLRGPLYDLSEDEITRRVKEAWDRGATEVCLQGGIHPKYTGETYINICRIVKAAVADIHIHAFSPLEIKVGANTLGLSLRDYLQILKEAGLGTLPGTAAEILDDEIRSIICPDKINTNEWLEVMETAHSLGIKTTSTIMFGHMDSPLNWARHLLAIRNLQQRTGGFTEFVPLPFIHMEAPMFLKGKSRRGPTFREAILMHAVSRLVLHPLIKNIQVSWVKMGPDGLKACLDAGANDVGGTLMNESISRAAGTEHGQEMTSTRMKSLIESLGRVPLQRNTLYGIPLESQQQKSEIPQGLLPITLTPLKRSFCGQS